MSSHHPAQGKPSALSPGNKLLKHGQNQGKQWCSQGKIHWLFFCAVPPALNQHPFCLTLHHFPSHSVPQFTHLENGNIAPCFPKGLGVTPILLLLSLILCPSL